MAERGGTCDGTSILHSPRTKPCHHTVWKRRDHILYQDLAVTEAKLIQQYEEKPTFQSASIAILHQSPLIPLTRASWNLPQYQELTTLQQTVFENVYLSAWNEAFVVNICIKHIAFFPKQYSLHITLKLGISNLGMI